MNAPQLRALFNDIARDHMTTSTPLHARRAGTPIGPHAEAFRVTTRALAGRTPTHRAEATR